MERPDEPHRPDGSPLGSNDAGRAHLETYLTQVQRYLHGLPDAEAREVIAELRSHILDKVDGAPTPRRVEAAIAELGAPREVAKLNVTERVVAHLETHRSPFSVLLGRHPAGGPQRLRLLRRSWSRSPAMASPCPC